MKSAGPVREYVKMDRVEGLVAGESPAFLRAMRGTHSNRDVHVRTLQAP